MKKLFINQRKRFLNFEMISEHFISLNLTYNDKILTNYPVIYYWDGSGKIDDLLFKERFIDIISEKLDCESYFDSKIYMIYAYIGDSQIDSIKKEFKVIEIFPLNKLPKLAEKYIKHVIDFLYKCAYKIDNEDLNIMEAYEKIKLKHPNKVTEDVLSNYIKVKLSEDFTELTNENISYIIEQWKRMI